MAFDKTPSVWLGAGYDLTSSVIGLETATTGRVDIAACTAVAATDVITCTAHNQKIGDIVQFTTTGTLPAGLSLATNYYVLTVPDANSLTVSATNGGTVVDITDTGSGTHTMNRSPAVPELTDAEANASTGDIRKILFALCDKFAQDWINTATADRPSNMTISKSISPNVTTGQETTQYVFRFTTAVAAGSREVVDE